MILSFLLGLAAGFATPHAEPFVRRAASAALKSEVEFSATDARLLTLLLLLALSALLTAGAGVNTVSLATVIGGALGYFGVPLYSFLRDPDGTDVPDAERWDGKVRAPGAASRQTNAQDTVPRAEADVSDADVLNAVEDAMREGPQSAPAQHHPKEDQR